MEDHVRVAISTRGLRFREPARDLDACLSQRLPERAVTEPDETAVEPTTYRGRDRRHCVRTPLVDGAAHAPDDEVVLGLRLRRRESCYVDAVWDHDDVRR
jgi:hypothetical protein